MNAQEEFVQVGKTCLHYYVAGASDAPPVVLLHGGGIDSAKIAWRLLIDPLAETHRVYAPDFPGYGKSDPPSDYVSYTTEFLIDTLKGFVDALQLEKFSLVGLSMGGAAALGYTLDHQERVERLILVDSYGLQDKAPFHLFSYGALHMPKPVQKTAWWFTRAHRMILRAGLSAIYFNPLALTGAVLEDAAESIRLEIFYEWLGSEIRAGGCKTNYTPRLPELDVPTLLIHGQFDRSVPVKWIKRAAEALPNGRLHTIWLCGHWVNRERPRAFNRAVIGFLLA